MFDPVCKYFLNKNISILCFKQILRIMSDIFFASLNIFLVITI